MASLVASASLAQTKGFIWTIVLGARHNEYDSILEKMVEGKEKFG